MFEVPFIEIPRQPGTLNFLNSRWPRLAMALHLLATTGISVRYELQNMLAGWLEISPNAGSLPRIFNSLYGADLIEQRTFKVACRHDLAAVRLATGGVIVCEQLGWPVVESEWGRLVRLHSADNQPKHTGAVLAFAFSARHRGWKVEVLPRVNRPNFYPDLRIEKDGKSIFVEVEMGSRKWDKWKLANKVQGFAAICAKTPVSRNTLINECRKLGISGMATDILTLARMRDEVAPLWQEEWSAREIRSG